MIEISLVILSHNRLKDLERNLRTLLGGPLPRSLEVIVVDNASSDGTVAMLNRLNAAYPALRLLLINTNLGVAGGRNAGCRAANGKFLICLDDDAAMASEDLLKVPAFFDAFPEAGILAFRVCHMTNGAPQNDHGMLPGPVANFHGAGYALRREVLERVGYLDEECTFGGEELDLSIRAHAAGFFTIYMPSIVIQHNSVPRLGKIGADRRVKWVYNHIRVLFKHFPPRAGFLYGGRLLLGHLYSGALACGPFLVPRLIGAAFKGLRTGRAGFHPLPRRTLAFYGSPNLRPEFGNVPLVAKLLAKL